MIEQVTASTDFPWTTIAGGGSAAALLGSILAFLRHISESRKENNETTQKISSDFAKTVKDNSDTFSETTRFILTDSKEREAKLHEQQTKLHELLRKDQ